MRILRRSLVSILLLTVSTGAIAQTESVSVEGDPLAQQVANHLIGVMDTAEQAASNPDRVSVQMTTCEAGLSTDLGEGGYLLYQEQALSEKLDQPYRQRFLWLVPAVDNQVESRAYRPTAPEQWIGLCDRPLAERQVAELGDYTCSVFLNPSVLGFVGMTPPAGCPTEVRGATSITNTIVLHSQGMDTWDRGFDPEGNQVWGAEDEPYRFRWRDELQGDR